MTAYFALVTSQQAFVKNRPRQQILEHYVPSPERFSTTSQGLLVIGSYSRGRYLENLLIDLQCDASTGSSKCCDAVPDDYPDQPIVS
jgi:hypothetical protein